MRQLLITERRHMTIYVRNSRMSYRRFRYEFLIFGTSRLDRRHRKPTALATTAAFLWQSRGMLTSLRTGVKMNFCGSLSMIIPNESSDVTSLNKRDFYESGLWPRCCSHARIKYLIDNFLAANWSIYFFFSS